MTIADIQTLARYLVDADTTSLTAAQLLIFTNNAYERVVGKLIAMDKNWNFGDSNYTANPTGLVTMTNSKEDYQLAGNSTSTGVSTATPLLTFLGASVKNIGGIWNPLKHISLWELFESDTDPVEYFKTDGLPQYYELREDFIILYPAPDNAVTVTLTSGLKVFYQRSADLFTAGQVTTGTKVPGFASPFHEVISYMSALPYAIKFKPDRVGMIQAKIMEIMGDEDRGITGSLERFYSRRDKSERKKMNMKAVSYI